MKETEAIKYPTGVTAEMVANWKQQHKKGIARIDSEAGFAAYLRRPTRDDMRELSSKQGVDAVTYAEIILDQLWLGGDEEIRTDDAIFYGVMPEVMDILDTVKATLKKY